MRRSSSVRPSRKALAQVLAGASLAAVALGAFTAATVTARAPAPAVVVTAASTGNPLAGRTWGVYKGPGDEAWQPYVDATGTQKTLLGYIALKPKAKWFGDWISDSAITDHVKSYVANSQAGDPQALVQMTIFRVQPWEHAACKRLPTVAEQASYKRWINNFAAGIGAAHAAVIMQPDGPFALCAPGGSRVLSNLVSYGARTLSALPHTSVYVEVGAADWPHAGAQGGVASAVKIALRGGVRYARGVALDGTHYSSTSNEIARGAAIVKALAAKGVPGKHVVINTAENGHPFEFGAYAGSNPDNAFVCSTKHDPVARTCVTLGIPPTTDVANAKWHLSATSNSLARRYVDGYMWFGRPWLYNQADPFVKSRALQLVRTSPFA